MFKIRSRKTGQFSKGGIWPDWSRNGKVWKRQGDLSSHFTQLDQRGRQIYLDHDAEVVEMEVVETLLIPAVSFIEAAADREEKREAESAERIRAWRERAERQQLAELQAKYGK